MKTSITARHCELTEDMKARTEERLNKLQRFFDRILDARVVVSFEKNRYSAEGVITANGTPLTSKVVADSERAALEQVLDKLEAQVRRHKDRMKRSRRGPGTGEAMAAETAPAPDEEADGAGSYDDADLETVFTEDPGDFAVTMPVAEATAQLRVSSREALGFTNPLSGRRMLVFKRRDGNVGVVDVDPDER
jgi:putative sigma-54 modulation protein